MANIFDNLKQLSQLRQQASNFQKTLAAKEFEIASQKNEVKIKVNGKMELVNIEISPEILTIENKQYIEKLIQKTFSAAQKEVEKAVSAELRAQAGSLNLPF
jgi:nucleoid-associated protein EbfC